MKCTRTISVISAIALAILILGSDAVLGKGLQITPRGTLTDYYIKSEEPCGTVTMVWTDDTRQYFRDDPGNGLVLTAAEPAVDVNVPVMTCWRLDFGNVEDFDWEIIKEALRLFHGVEIGAAGNCQVVHWMKPIACHSVRASFYPQYERRLFEIRSCKDVAMISVLVPREGVAVVYNDVHVMRGSTPCNNASPIELASSLGICASIDNMPYNGAGCSPGSNKWKPMDQPATDEYSETATWGKIKAVYGD